jgi:hypothetical protein
MAPGNVKQVNKFPEDTPDPGWGEIASFAGQTAPAGKAKFITLYR